MAYTHCALCQEPLPEQVGPGRPRKFCKRSHRQRYYEAGLMGPIRTKQDKAYLLYRQGNECADCCEPLTIESMEVDHFIPVSAGGPTQWNNLRALCGTCNRKKGDKVPRYRG